MTLIAEGHDPVEGPAWSKQGLDVATSRFPLRVETHVSRMVGKLLPGVITVTPHARYFALHPLVYAEMRRRGLDHYSEGPEFMRRCEVLIGAVSSLHEHGPEYGEVHGEAYIKPDLSRKGHLDLAEFSKPNKYSQAAWGFSDAYYGSELRIGAVKPQAGETPLPGDRLPEGLLREALGDLFDFVDRDTVSLEDLDSANHLCFCSAATNIDGELLRRIFVDPNSLEGFEASDSSRRATSQLIARVVEAGAEESLQDAFTRAVAYGPFIVEDEIASNLSIAQAWRGVILRNYSVGAWRRLWSWLVGQLDDPMTADQLASRTREFLPDVSVAAFVAELGQTTDGSGNPLPVEFELRAGSFGPEPAVELALLAIGARRARELEGATGLAFVGRDEPLAPLWMAAQLDSAIEAGRTVPEFSSELVLRLVERAHRVALDKMRQLKDGRLWMPTRLRQREGLLYRTSTEGWTDVALRIETYGRVLFEAGVLARSDGAWSVTDAGRALLV